MANCSGVESQFGSTAVKGQARLDKIAISRSKRCFAESEETRDKLSLLKSLKVTVTGCDPRSTSVSLPSGAPGIPPDPTCAV